MAMTSGNIQIRDQGMVGVQELNVNKLQRHMKGHAVADDGNLYSFILLVKIYYFFLISS